MVQKTFQRRDFDVPTSRHRREKTIKGSTYSYYTGGGGVGKRLIVLGFEKLYSGSKERRLEGLS